MNIYDYSGNIAGRTLEIDSTLTQSGMAADAEVVGDTITLLNAGLETAEADITRISGEDGVSMLQTSFVSKSKTELAVADDVVRGYSINSTTGEPEENASYFVTDYAEIDPSKTYFISSAIRDRFFYGDDKTYIGSSMTGWGGALLTGKNLIYVKNPAVKYIRIQGYLSSISDGDILLQRYKDYCCGFTDPHYTGFSSDCSDMVSETGLINYAIGDSTRFIKTKNIFNRFASDWALNIQLSNDGNLAGSASETNNSLTVLDYIPVAEGEALCCNFSAWKVCFYDADKVFVSKSTPQRPRATEALWATPVASGAAFARLDIKYSANGGQGTDQDEPNGFVRSFAEISKISLWVSDDKTYPLDALSTPETAFYKIQSKYVLPDYNSIPDHTNELYRMIKCEAIRAVNRTKHVLRIGNFNQYVVRGTQGWSVIRNMLADYGIDICGFEEAVYGAGVRYKLGDYLKGWQFGYTTDFYPLGTDKSPYSNREAVSAFPIVEAEELFFPEISETIPYKNTSALRTKIKLPRHLDCTGGDQYLGLYVIHPSVYGSPEIQEQEIQTCLDAMETDGCAFHIITADTNAFAVDPGTGKLVVWEWMKAKGFKLANDGLSKTITEPSPDHQGSIDQIFVSSNIEIVNFNVVNSYEYPVTVNGVVYPLSDHDFIYADIVLDYSGVVTRMRPMTEVAFIQNLTHVQSDAEDNYHVSINPNTSTITSQYHGTLNSGITAHLSADSGYTISTVTVYVAGTDATSRYYSDGVVTIPAGAEVSGDIVVTATAI